MKYILKEYPPETDELKIKNMVVCFCRYCGEYTLILPHLVEAFPIRKRDMSRVITEEGTDFKYNLHYGGDTYVKRDRNLEKQCRLYCSHCKLLIAYRLAPPGDYSKYFYLVRGSITTDPDIMLHEVKNYKLRIPSYLKRDPDDPTRSTLIFTQVEYEKGCNRISGATDNRLLVDMKYKYEEEGKANGLLIQFFSSLLEIPVLNFSFSIENGVMAMRVDGIDYEDMYVKLKDLLPKKDEIA